jgi:hypothetical protein
VRWSTMSTIGESSESSKTLTAAPRWSVTAVRVPAFVRPDSGVRLLGSAPGD